MGRPMLEERTYQRTHTHLRQTKGSASKFACVRCGEKAREWAYSHGDPHELVEDGKAYSLDYDHYHPMCPVCHHEYDKPRAQMRQVMRAPSALVGVAAWATIVVLSGDEESPLVAGIADATLLAVRDWLFGADYDTMCSFFRELSEMFDPDYIGKVMKAINSRAPRTPVSPTGVLA